MIEVRGVNKRYSRKGQPALCDITLAFGDTGLVAVCGPMSCGKSTLLNILGGIEKPDSGQLVVDGVPMGKYNEGKWGRYRNARVGTVLQEPVLIGERTVFENVELALTISGVGRKKRRAKTGEVLRLLGISDCASKKPAELSGAQLRLAAVARALAKDPDILIADDPTAGLGKASAGTVMKALADVARSRLVIMATGNEKMAARRASRIIRLEKGRVAGDALTGAGGPAGPLGELAGAGGGDGLRKRERRSMPFLTAAAYSLRNISSKKGRTALTAIASATSMVGIALIIALGTGASNGINAMEEASIATGPITVGKSGLDLTGLLSSEKMKQMGASDETEEGSRASAGAAKVNTVEGSIEELSRTLAELNSHVRDNDLAGFKQYVDSNSNGILDYIDTVQYDYGVAPLIYGSDTSHGVEVLNPSTLSGLLSRRANSTTSSLNSLGGFHEMIDNQRILSEQMDVVAGTWPKGPEECVVVLDANGQMSDLTLYNLGLYDHEAVDKAISAAMSGENIEFPDAPSELSYEQLMSTSFTVLPRTSLYQRNDQRGTWSDKSMDDGYVSAKLAQDGIRLSVVGIVKPKPGTAALLPEGVGYPHELTKRIIDISAQSDITKQQLANPDIDVFTGKSFAELKEHPTGNLDLDNIVTVNEQSLNHLIGMFAFEVEEEKEEAAEEEKEEAPEKPDPDMQAVWDAIEKIDWSQFEINTRDVLDAVNEQRIYDAISLASMLDPSQSGLQLSPEQQSEVSARTGEMVANFTVWAIGEGASAEELRNPSAVGRYWQRYLRTDEGKRRMAELDLLVGKRYGDAVRGQLENYLTSVYTEVIIDEVSAEIIEQALDEIGRRIAAEIDRQLPIIADELGRELDKAITAELERLFTELERDLEVAGQELDKALDETGRQVDAFANDVGNDLSNLIQVNLNEEDLIAYMNNLIDGSEIGFDNNIAKLGYADMGNPLSMSIYPKNLDAKHKVVDIISGYNSKMEKAGAPDRTIIYNNSSGDLTEVLSAVVGAVGVALIALIGIAFVVGSLMMAIIVYTGISSRKREMGLLRTLGASRLDLATMCNMETLVVGLISGALSVGIVYAISAIANGAARSSGGADIMVLPPAAAIGLVLLAGLLPLLAGLIPSIVMSFKNPAESLKG